ncbi:MAG: hypothetical protein IKI11_10540 [Neisseriaceae bacterium]|nr:hypothetical protein [Neisseriaceae bacterium]
MVVFAMRLIKNISGSLKELFYHFVPNRSYCCKKSNLFLRLWLVVTFLAFEHKYRLYHFQAA